MKLLLPFVVAVCALKSVFSAPAISGSATYDYEVVPGVFVQDDPATVPAEVGPIPPRFGLIDESNLRWLKLRARVLKLNLQAPKGTQYKVVFFGRHGEGYHNVAEAYYGTAAWEASWAKLNGNGTIVWGPDAKITPRGVGQAETAYAAWQTELGTGLSKYVTGIPIPETLYASPLSRASETAVITFKWLLGTGFGKKKGLIVENFREVMGVHTCDLRDTRTYIETTYGEYFNVEQGFTEADELWRPDYREPTVEMDARLRKALHAIFNGPGTFISVTAHSGAINSMFRNIGHRPYSLPTGGVVPVLLRAAKV